MEVSAFISLGQGWDTIQYNFIETGYFYIQSFINIIIELNMSSLYKLIKAFTANSNPPGEWCKYVSKFVLNKSHRSEYGIYCSTLK